MASEDLYYAIELEAHNMFKKEYKAANPGCLGVCIDDKRIQELMLQITEKQKTDRVLQEKLLFRVEKWRLDRQIHRQIENSTLESHGDCTCGLAVGTCKACGGFTRY